MSTLEGVRKILVSGLRASVVMEEGKTLVEAKVKDALGAQKLNFVSMEVVERPLPKVIFKMEAKGVT